MDGFQKYFQLGTSLERMFPRLCDLIEIHLEFLSKLRQRQRESPVVTSIADILLEQFSNNYAVKLKSAYGKLQFFLYAKFISYSNNNSSLSMEASYAIFMQERRIPTSMWRKITYRRHR